MSLPKVLNKTNCPVGTRMLIRRSSSPEGVKECTVVEWSYSGEAVKLHYSTQPAGASSWMIKQEMQHYDVLEILGAELANPCSSDPGRPTFTEALARVINQYSIENGSNTPDFILAEFLTGCIEAFNKAQKTRESWYGRSTIAPVDVHTFVGPGLATGVRYDMGTTGKNKE